MAATWSGSDDSNGGDMSSDDEELMANFIAFASSHKSKGSSEEENVSQVEIDSSDDCSSSQSTNGNMDRMALKDYIEKFESSRLKNKREIRRLNEENLDLSTQVNHLSEEVVRTMESEDKLIKELDLSKRSEEGLKRELEVARELMAKMDSSTKKLDHMLDVGKRPSDKRGLGFEDEKMSPTPSKTVFVKIMNLKESPPRQLPRKKIDIGECSRSAQMKVALRSPPQAQPPRAPQANFLQPKVHQGKRPIMQAQPRKQ